MSELNKTDWELINTFHDAEMSTQERKTVEARIQTEPELAEALREVAAVSSSLSALRPSMPTTPILAQTAPANKNDRRKKWLWGGAAAAVLALAMMLNPASHRQLSVLDIHAEFAAQRFFVSADEFRTVTSVGGVEAPDLTGANLTPVAMRSLESGDVTHYSGRNGCRLSYFRGSFDFGKIGLKSEYQVANWKTSDVVHMIIATGMDQHKFDAIAEYLKLLSRQQVKDQMVASLIDTTANAERCFA